MKARFPVLYTLPANLYVTGAPLLITSGELQTNPATRQTFAQFSLRNISSKPIKAVSILVQPLDPAGRPLGDELPYMFLDLNAPRDALFGQDQLIPFPHYATRSFTVRVSEVIFFDNTIWTAPDTVWASLPQQKLLPEALGAPELAKQYQLHFGNDCILFPDQIGDLWRCACGAVNHVDEHACHHCKRTLGSLRSVSTDSLEAEKNERLDRERAELLSQTAEEKVRNGKTADAKAKKRRRALTIGIPALAVLLIAAAVIFFVTRKPASATGDTLSASFNHAIALKDDGTVVAVGDNEYGRCDVSDWTNIVAVAAGYDFSVGVQANGKVVATGYNYCGQCNVSKWENVVTVAAGSSHAVGLRKDGTVVAVGQNAQGQCSVKGWTDIVAIAAGFEHTVGLRSNGTVVAVGNNEYGECDVSEWHDIIAVAASYHKTVGLKSDGTVVFAGVDYDYSDHLSQWTDIVAIAVGRDHIVGLRSDGSVVATGNNAYGQCAVSAWHDIVAIAAGGTQTYGIRSDGTVVAAGNNDCGQCNVSAWTNIMLPPDNEKK